MSTHTRKFLSLALFMASLITINGLYAVFSADRSAMSRKPECRTAVVAREMLESNDYLIPTINGTPRLKKPPLYYWSILPFAHFSDGVTEAAARYPSILCGILLVALTGIFAWFRFPILYAGELSSKGNQIKVLTALLASLLLISMHGFWFTAERSVAESMLALSCLLVNASLYFNLHQPRKRWLILAYIFSGVSFMVKGPVFLLFTWPAYLWFGRKQIRKQRSQHIIGLILFLVIALPWYVFVITKLPEGLSIFTGEVGSRFQSSAIHPQPFYFYFKDIIVKSFPIILWLPFACYVSVKKNNSRPGEMFLLVTLGLGILFITFLQTKQSHYLMPLYPILALLISDLVVVHLLEKNKQNCLSRILEYINTLAIATGVLVSIIAGWLIIEYGFLLEGIVIIVWGTGAYLILSRYWMSYSRTLVTIVWLSGLVCGSYWTYQEIFVPYRNLSLNQKGYYKGLNFLKSAHPIATDINDPCFFYNFGSKISRKLPDDAEETKESSAYYLSTSQSVPGFKLVTSKSVKGDFKLWKKINKTTQVTSEYSIFESNEKNWTINNKFSKVKTHYSPACGKFDLLSLNSISVLKLEILSRCTAREFNAFLADANLSLGEQFSSWNMLWVISNNTSWLDGSLQGFFITKLINRFVKAQSINFVLDNIGLSDESRKNKKTFWLNSISSSSKNQISRISVKNDLLILDQKNLDSSYKNIHTYTLRPDSVLVENPKLN